MSVHFSVNIAESCEFDSIDGLDDDVFEETKGSPIPPRRIPLNRLVSRDEKLKRLNYINVFNKYDTSSQGFLEKRDLRESINKGKAKDLPEKLVKIISELSEEELDGQIDFDDFVHMSEKLKDKFSIGKSFDDFCKTIIAPRNDFKTDFLSRCSIETIYSEKLGEYDTQMKLCPPPLTMVIISLIEISFYIIYVVFLQDCQKTNPDLIYKDNCTIRSELMYHPLKREQIWRFFTYMFVHDSLEHLLFNVVIQIGLGLALECVHCWWRVATVYLSGVLAASLAQSVIKECTPLIGASGGVYAIITAHIATVILNWHEMKYGPVQLFVFMILCTCDVFMDNVLNVDGSHSGVAHLFGALAGILVGIGVLRNLRVRPYQKMLWFISVALYCILVFYGIFVNFKIVYVPIEICRRK